MTNQTQLILRRSLIVLLCLALVVEIIRDLFVAGDFSGYVIAGNLVLNGKDIYSNTLNTWPPFFSLFCVPLAMLDGLSNYGLRLVWLCGSVAAFLAVITISSQLISGKGVQFSVFSKQDENKLSLTGNMILVPLLIMLRFLLENLSNIQINVYLLLLCLISIRLFSKDNNFLSGLLLAFAVSLKVYPVFLLLFFLFKREYRQVAWTLLFILAFNALTFVVWSNELSIQYYSTWYHKFVLPYADALHKNQSLFAFLRRLLTGSDTGFFLKINFMDIEVGTLKLISYLLIALAALYPAWLFRKKFSGKGELHSLLEFSFMLTAIPLLSPLSWKAYFIFLWMGYFISWYLIFEYPDFLNRRIKTILKLLFFASVTLTVFSTELIVGPWLSDVLEVCSAITLGSVLLLIIQLVLYIRLDKSKPLQKVF